MTTPTEAEAADQFAQAVAAFRRVQELVLTAHRKLRRAPKEDQTRFWAGTGAKLEQHQRTCAAALVTAYQEFARTGAVAGAGDRGAASHARGEWPAGVIPISKVILGRRIGAPGPSRDS